MSGEILDFDYSVEMLDRLPSEEAKLTVSQEMVIFLMRHAADVVSQNPPGEHRTKLLQRIYFCLMKTAVDAVEGVEPGLQ
jgi:hypothetical protein